MSSSDDQIVETCRKVTKLYAAYQELVREHEDWQENEDKDAGTPIFQRWEIEDARLTDWKKEAEDDYRNALQRLRELLTGSGG